MAFMRLAISTASVIVAFTAQDALAQSRGALTPGSFASTNVNVITMQGQAPLRNATVVV